MKNHALHFSPKKSGQLFLFFQKTVKHFLMLLFKATFRVNRKLLLNTMFWESRGSGDIKEPFRKVSP